MRARLVPFGLRLFTSLLALSAAPWWVSAATSFHLSPEGSDNGTGAADAPLQSLGSAIAKARTSSRPATLLLGPGRYELQGTLELGPQDSGLTIAGVPNARVVLSGGRRLAGWVSDASRPNLWRVTLPEVRDGTWYFHQLFIDGHRAQRARHPNEGFLRGAGRMGTNSPIALPFKAGDLKAEWASLPDARLIMLMKWTDLQVPFRAIDTNIALLSGGPRAYWMDETDARYWVENIPGALDAPGEWYLDRTSGTLSLLAPAGVNPNAANVVAPKLATLLRIRGDAEAKRAVDTVTLRGLVLAETDYEMPAEGMISPQAAVPIRGAIRGEFASNCVIEECVLENLGGYSLELGRGTQGWRVVGNEMRDAGGGGIRIGEPNDRQPDEFTACRNHFVADNHLHRLGRIFAPAVGVIVFQSGGNRIVHNRINDLYYTAVSVGWNWGYRETPCRENVIEFNHLHDVGQGRLSDMGGVYTLGIQAGTVVRNNLIHDVTSYDYGGWGLYPDEGSTGILFENNLVYRCKSSGFHQHYGRENIVRNNVFAFNREHQLMRTREEDHLSFYFTNNIVLFDSGDLLGSSWKNDRFLMDGNVYFDTRVGASPSNMRFAGATWDEWRHRGHDTHSLVANPLFEEPTRLDFRLKPGSPALNLGFRPLDLSGVGPRKPSERR